MRKVGREEGKEGEGELEMRGGREGEKEGSKESKERKDRKDRKEI